MLIINEYDERSSTQNCGYAISLGGNSQNYNNTYYWFFETGEWENCEKYYLYFGKNEILATNIITLNEAISFIIEYKNKNVRN